MTTSTSKPGRDPTDHASDKAHAPPAPLQHESVEIDRRTSEITAQQRVGASLSTNLRLPRSPLIGRAHEIATIQRLLLQNEVGLLTLTGPGGIGKTRLAMQVAVNLLDHFVHGVYFVSLAPITDPTLVIAAIAQVLDVRDAGTSTLSENLLSFLRDRQLLLVLDNFEQVAVAAPLMATLLAECPRLKMLVTSRATLHLYGEHLFPVPPLALPDSESVIAKSLDSVPGLAHVAAVALFVQRALAIKPDFALTAGNAAVVAEICTALDGLPLAIELAAAKLQLFSPATLLAHLQQRLSLLTGGAHDLPARQRTMRAEIGWSYDLLPASIQRLFRHLALFSDGFTLEAAQAVGFAPGIAMPIAVSIAVSSSSEVIEANLLEELNILVDQNLVRQEQGVEGEARFSMLETIREYGLEQLAANGELGAVQRAHADFYVRLVEEGNRHLRSGQQGIWIPRLEREQGNWRMALAWGFSSHDSHNSPDNEHALRLAAALWLFWLHCGYLNEGRQHLEDLVARGETASNQHLLASAILGAGALAWLKGDNQVARLRLEQSLSLARALHNKRLIAEVLIFLGWLTLYEGDDVQASLHFDESLTLATEMGDKMALADVSSTLGDLARERGNYEQAHTFFEQSLALFQELGAKSDVALALVALGEVVRLRGDLRRATALFKESLAQSQALGITRGFRIPKCLEELAGLCAKTGELADAARLFGAAEALCEMIGTGSSDQVAEMHRQMGAGAYSEAWAAGRSMLPEQMIDYALALPNFFESATPTPERAPVVPSTPIYPAGLTLREVEVLRLLAEGLSYAQIAKKLFIAQRTVNAHLTSIYAKLGVTSRAAATHFAEKNGLI